MNRMPARRASPRNGPSRVVTETSFGYVGGMKFIAATALLLAPGIALAADPHPLGTYQDWTAAAYGAGANKACYAFTRVKSSNVVIPKRGEVMLTVTQRKAAHDEVTLAAGYAYPKNAKVTLTVGNSNFDLYTSGQTAFAEKGAGAVAAFKAGATATAKGPGPKGQTIEDNFSLSGFTDAYDAITKACS